MRKHGPPKREHAAAVDAPADGRNQPVFVENMPPPRGKVRFGIEHYPVHVEYYGFNHAHTSVIMICILYQKIGANTSAQPVSNLSITA